MTPPPLWDRLRRARVVQVLAVYLGASWGVLQISDTLSEALSLPAWVSPVAIILLLVGLVIILATAWVQSLPSTTAAEQAGEIPTDWQIAPSEAVRSLKRGRLPHLTWGRVVLGGIFALSLLFGGTGLWVALTGGPGLLGPAEVGASDAAEGIAILPFSVSGVGDEPFWGEGMVDLLSTNLDGMGGYRTIDSRTVLARWREHVGDPDTPELSAMLRAAGETGARYAVVGSSVGVGDRMRLTTEIYDLADGREIGSGQVDGSQDDPMRLIDDLSLETMRRLLAGGGEELATSRNLADLTTASVPALRAYLEGERYYRQAEFPRAVEAYERALVADSTFALALFRISDAYGWLESVQSETAIELGARSVLYMDRLSPRNAAIVAAGNALYENDLTYVEELRAAVRKYPDDPEAWFMLGEMYIHMGEATGAGPEEALEAVMRAIELDPGFAPYYVHAIDQSVILGDVEGASRLIDRYLSFSESAGLQQEYLLAFRILYGSADERAEAWRGLDDLDDQGLSVLWATFGPAVEDLPTALEVAAYAHRRFGQDRWGLGRARASVGAGQVGRARSLIVDSLPDPPDPHTIYVAHTLSDFDLAAQLDAVRQCAPGPECDLWRGALAAEAGDWVEHERTIAHIREAAEALRSEGDSLRARFPESEAEALVGYGQLLRGDAAAARRTLADAQGRSAGAGDMMIRLWLARANEELGRDQDAIRWYGLMRSTEFRSLAYERRARIAERTGDVDTARASWRMVASAYAQADPGHPGATAARAALERLGG